MGNEHPPPHVADSEVGTTYADTASHCDSHDCLTHTKIVSEDAVSVSDSLSWLEANDLETLIRVDHDIDQNVLCRMNPYNIAHERIRNWPNLKIDFSKLLYPYDEVKDTGLPNCLSAKIPIESTLLIILSSICIRKCLSELCKAHSKITHLRDPLIPAP